MRRHYTVDPATASANRIDHAASDHRPVRDNDSIRGHHLLSGLTSGPQGSAQAAIEERERVRAARRVIIVTVYAGTTEDERAAALEACGVDYDDANPGPVA